jgi:phosphoribosylaminoimidazolecarboxamide formyltransferase/IMP cyclohydrolase
LPFEALVEEIDIGGPSLLRAAAKNFHDVLVVVEPSDYDRVLQGLDVPGGPPLSLRFDLARRAIRPHRGVRPDDCHHARGVSPWTNGGAFSRSGGAAALPERWSPDLTKIRDLRYGENPHQPARGIARATAALAVRSSPGEGALVHEPSGSGRGSPDCP